MGFKNYAFPVVMPAIDEVHELTGFASFTQELEAFQIAYELGREDALDGSPCIVCGALPAQRAGYAFGYVGEIAYAQAYFKWHRFGRAA